MATQKVTVGEKIKDRFENAKLQLVDLEKKIGDLPREAKKKVDEVQTRIDEVPGQLRGAWDHVLGRVREALDYASRDDLAALAEKVDDLAKKVEKLIRGEKIRNAAKDSRPHKKA